MKKIIILITLVLCMAAAFGQEKKLVVPPFEARNAKLTKAELDNLQDLLINAFINTGRFEVPDRGALAMLVGEQKFQLSDWSDDKKSAEMGKVLNADYLVRVLAMHDGEMNVLTARIIDVNTTKGLSSGEMEFATQREARNKMKVFAEEIVQNIFNAGRTVSGGTGGQQRAGFVRVEGGSFQMGGDKYSNEKPVHRVTVSGFSMAKYLVTQKEWREVMGTSPSHFKGDNLPVESVSWYDAVDYCNKLSQKEGLTLAYTINGSGDDRTVSWNRNANGYRLPTEAEWEYAAKGGNGSPGNYTYAGSNNPDEVAWYDGNSAGSTQAAGTKAPNALGIYDMSGNVWEWCWDWYSDSYYGSSPASNPLGASSGSLRVRRGGSWYDSAVGVRSAGRRYFTPSNRNSGLGFRLVRP